MLTSLALIFLTGLLLASLFEKLKLPRIIGMLLAGILLGPYVLNLLDDSVLSISSDLRQIALIIILIKAGLSLNLSDLKKVGRPAILMSFVPATFEIIGYVLLAPTLLGISKIEAAVMGSVLAAEILLFVLVGAAVDIRYTMQAGIAAVAMILLALVFRAVGVCLCMTKTSLNFKERLFCVIAYLPKATVQAAIGSIPLSMGLACGQIVLSVAVLAILITAPLGAIGIDRTYKKLLVITHHLQKWESSRLR